MGFDIALVNHLQLKFAFDDVVGVSNRGIWVSELVSELFDVIRVTAFVRFSRANAFIENRGHARIDRLVDVGRRLQHFVLDFDSPCRFFSGVTVCSRDCGNRVSGVERLVAGKNVVNGPLEIRGTFTEVDHLVRSLRQVSVGDDGVYTVHRLGG